MKDKAIWKDGHERHECSRITPPGAMGSLSTREHHVKG